MRNSLPRNEKCNSSRYEWKWNGWKLELKKWGKIELKFKRIQNKLIKKSSAQCVWTAMGNHTLGWSVFDFKNLKIPPLRFRIKSWMIFVQCFPKISLWCFHRLMFLLILVLDFEKCWEEMAIKSREIIVVLIRICEFELKKFFKGK